MSKKHTTTFTCNGCGYQYTREYDGEQRPYGDWLTVAEVGKSNIANDERDLCPRCRDVYKKWVNTQQAPHLALYHWEPASAPPDDDRAVLVYGTGADTDNQDGYDVAWYRNGRWRFGRAEHEMTEVTHWMDIPDVPIESPSDE